MHELEEQLSAYLSRPYSRVLIPDPETGTYAARIVEFPGCVAEGSTPEEAYQQVERAGKDWVAAALDLGQEIPRPAVEQSHSGRILLRLPKSLHQRCAELAAREATSLNQFVVATLAERVGAAGANGATSPTGYRAAS